MAGPITPSGAALTPNGAYQQNSDITTLVWGTVGLGAGLGTGGTYVVKSARFSDRMEKFNIENGTGFDAFILQLRKGTNVEFTCVDDDAITPPTPGTVVTLTNTAYGASVKYLILERGFSYARKQDGEITLSAENYTSITLS